MLLILIQYYQFSIEHINKLFHNTIIFYNKRTKKKERPAIQSCKIIYLNRLRSTELVDIKVDLAIGEAER